MGLKRNKKLTATANDIVSSKLKEHNSIIAAYSCGSFARGDMVSGSDVDIGFITDGYPASNKVPPEVHRKIIDDVLFEWGFITRDAYDVKAVLEDAALTQDMVTAKIWFDPKNFLSNLQNTLRQEYIRPESIKLRALNQLQIVENNFDEFAESVRNVELDNLLTKIFLIIRHAYAIPSAILNRPVTHCRAYLYCKKDSNELGFNDFPNLVNNILGANNFTVDKVKYLLSMSFKLFDSCGLPQHAIDAYKAHLKIVNYLLNINEHDGAMWPIFFWVVGAWHETKRDNLNEISDKIEELFLPIRKELRLVETTDIESRIGIIENVILKCKEMITCRHLD
jgi:predicted nucleotidyltransferase